MKNRERRREDLDKKQKKYEEKNWIGKKEKNKKKDNNKILREKS